MWHHPEMLVATGLISPILPIEMPQLRIVGDPPDMHCSRQIRVGSTPAWTDEIVRRRRGIEAGPHCGRLKALFDTVSQSNPVANWALQIFYAEFRSINAVNDPQAAGHHLSPAPAMSRVSNWKAVKQWRTEFA